MSTGNTHRVLFVILTTIIRLQDEKDSLKSQLQSLVLVLFYIIKFLFSIRAS